MTINVNKLSPLVYIDYPIQNQIINGTMLLSGWALDASDVKEVDIYIDGQFNGKALTGLSRIDVNRIYPGYLGGSTSGFSYELNLDLNNIISGNHKIAVKELGNDGTTAESDINIVKPRPITYIDCPQSKDTFDNTIQVSGWALNASGIKQVKIYLDNTNNLVGSASIGISRPDVKKAYPNYIDGTNSGYNYTMDTSSLTSGNHTLIVQALGDDNEINQTNVLITPKLVTSNIFSGNVDFNSNYFRIPHMIITKHGTIVAGSDIRYNGISDFGPIDQGIARSIDGGKTWINKQIILQNNHIVSDSRVMDSTMIYNANTDTIFVFAVKLDDDNTWYTKTSKNNWDMVYTTSSDDGKTWTKEVSIKHVIDAYPKRMLFLGGVGSGIVMNNGTMVLPIQCSNVNQKPYSMQSGMIYSRDNGVTWEMSKTLVPENSSECNIVETSKGLLINARDDGSGKRTLYQTNDMGTTWIATASNNSSRRIIQPNGCMGSMIKGPNGILYSQPINPSGNRTNPTLMQSKDNGATWQIVGSIYSGYKDGYTCANFYINRLYIVLEVLGNIIFKDITNLIN